MDDYAIVWRLNDLMAQQKIMSLNDLHAQLECNEYKISKAQLRRLVAQSPQRVELELLAALCRVLECSVGELLYQGVFEMAIQQTHEDVEEDVAPDADKPAMRREPVYSPLTQIEIDFEV